MTSSIVAMADTFHGGRSKATLVNRVGRPDGQLEPDVQARFGDATEALKQTGVRELACIRVVVSDHELSLDGEVGSFYLKQLATEAVRPHAAGLSIRNRLQVPDRGRG